MILHHSNSTNIKASVLFLSAMLMLLIVSIGCGRESARSDKPMIAVSYEAQKYILEQIAGEGYEIKVLLPSGSDPEMYEPDMRTMAGMDGADAYFTTSTLGFEERMGEIMRQNYPQLPIVNLSTGISIIEGTHLGVARGALSHHHPDDKENHSHIADPHLLSSIENVSIVAGNMLRGLQATYPDKAGEFQNNYLEFEKELQLQKLRMDSLMAPLQGAAFVVMHPAMSYFARDYKLRQVALEQDGKEASPRQLKERLDEASGAHPIILFYERGHAESGAKSMAATLGVEAYPINLEGADFLQQLQEVAVKCREMSGRAR